MYCTFQFHNYMYVCISFIMNCVLQYYNVIFQPRRSSSSSKFTLASGTVATDDSKSHSLHRSQRYTCSDCTCAVHVSPFLFFLSPLTLAPSLPPSLLKCFNTALECYTSSRTHRLQGETARSCRGFPINAHPSFHLCTHNRIHSSSVSSYFSSALTILLSFT